jgi:hypothetical protein
MWPGRFVCKQVTVSPGHIWTTLYITKFFLIIEMFETKFPEKIETHILCSITSPQKSYPLWDKIEKYGGAKEVTGYNTAHALWMLDK